MARKPADILPITPATVEILGDKWPARSTIWAGLRLHEAVVRDVSIWSNDDHHLEVPWCHVNDPSDGDQDAIYRVRSLDERYRFVKARNGAWVLRLAVDP